MTDIQSLLAHRIKQSSALIARVRPLVQSAIAAARRHEITDPVAVLADSLRWRRRLIAALSELDDCAFRMALLDAKVAPAGEQQLLSALQTEMSNLIEVVAQLTEALMPRRTSRPLPK
jgi:hypothetical protein